MSNSTPTKIPLSYDWGRSISPEKGKAARHQFHNWKHDFPIASPPRKNRSPYLNRTTVTDYQSSKTFVSTGASSIGSPQMPNYVKTDKVCLRFYGYFQEGVNASPDEVSRIRPVTMYYFVVDDTIKMVEPKSNNSGMPQGALVKRHRVPKPDCTFYTLDDLKFGTEIDVYGKIIRIIDADGFTKKYCGGEENLGQSEPMPSDSYSAIRYVKDHQAEAVKNKDTAFKDYVNAIAGAFVSSQDLGQYIKYDGVILKFRAVWDKNPGVYYSLKYFMATKEIEITEDQVPGKGKLDFPRLICRQKVPKYWKEGNRGPGGKDKNELCYEHTDLYIGAKLNIYNRTIEIQACDTPTREFYLAQGVTFAANVQKPSPPPPMEINKIPPRDAFTIGTDEDTIQSCLYLVPPKPKKDEKKLLDNDGKILRFKAAMESTVPVNKLRQFVVRFFLADDTLMVFEQPVANLGVPGGKFVERRLLKKRDANGNRTIRYTPADFKVGGQIVINTFVFNLLGCDSWTRKYYEDVVGDAQPQNNQ